MIDHLVGKGHLAHTVLATGKMTTNYGLTTLLPLLRPVCHYSVVSARHELDRFPEKCLTAAGI